MSLFPESVRDEPCPRCGAFAGEACTGRGLTHPDLDDQAEYHVARWRLRELRHARAWVPRFGELVLVGSTEDAAKPAMFVGWTDKGEAIVEVEAPVRQKRRSSEAPLPGETERRRETAEALALWRKIEGRNP
jgi:hypothetical protein